MSEKREPTRCPTCMRVVAQESNAFPFCSERCRLIDLGAWLDEKYRVAGSEEEDTAKGDG